MAAFVSKGRGWHRIPDDVRAAVVEDYKSGLNICQLSEKYKISWLGAQNILKKAGVEIRKNGTFLRRNAITEEKRQLIVNEYVSGSNSTGLSTKHDLSQSIISRILKQAGVTRSNEIAHRKYTFDEVAFDVITEESAYWAGMLMTDGSVVNDKGKKRSPAVVLGLAKEDEGHVLKFRSFLKSTHPVLEFMATSPSGKLFPAVKLQIRSERLAASLKRFGVTAGKLYRTKVIGLGEDRNFWRGVIDGDGCIHVRSEDGFPQLVLVGTKGLLNQFKDYVCKMSKTKANVYPIKGAKAFQYHLVGSPALAILRHLYSNCTIALDRKLEAAKKIMALPLPESPVPLDSLADIRQN